jgi:hypothetical protein
MASTVERLSKPSTHNGAGRGHVAALVVYQNLIQVFASDDGAAAVMFTGDQDGGFRAQADPRPPVLPRSPGRTLGSRNWYVGRETHDTPASGPTDSAALAGCHGVLEGGPRSTDPPL